MSRLIFSISLTSSERYGVIGIASSPSMDDFTICWMYEWKNMENEIINERFLGTIFGQAVGDALGLSTEFMSKQEVDRFYPNGIEDYS